MSSSRPDPPVTKRFRVAFSFAGEKRSFVADVAEILAKRFGRDAILYDKYHEAEFARRNLGLYLPELYHKGSDLVVVVVCPNYDRKQWTGLEWTAIHDLLSQRQDAEVMLCRFERANVTGLYSTAGYAELDNKTPAETAKLIIHRLQSNGIDTRKVKRPAKSNGANEALILRPPNNLPRLHSFFGRTDELAKIAEALSPKTRTWGALIDGPGGMGKTSLAIRAAELVPVDQFDRILFISSKERKMTPEGERPLTDFVTPGYLAILNEVSRLLKRSELAKQPESARSRLLIEILEKTRVLLILDNLESLPKDHQNRLFEFLSQLPTGCKAIATSRRRTDVDARIIRLAKLDQDAALELISELAVDRPLLAKAYEEERIHLYEETGGNPLVLRWIAGQLGRGRCRTVAQALDLLRKASAENDPLEFIFGDLLETFTENETKILAALSYFSQQVEVNLIAELGSISKTAAETALADLANRALVVPDEEERHFALVPMVADFLRRKRPEAIAETGERLECRAYALITENFEKSESFPVLDAAWFSLAPALPLFLASNTRLQKISSALFQFLNFTGRYDESLSLNQQAEANAEAAGDPYTAGWRAYQVGWIYYLRGQGDKVLECAERAANHWQRAKASVRDQHVALQLRGLGHALNQNYGAAIAAHREALALDRSLSAESLDVFIDLNTLAEVERVSGDFAAAERHMSEALRIARVVGGDEDVAVAKCNLALLLISKKNWIAAEAVAREALVLSEKIGSEELVSNCCHHIAEALVRQAKNPDAISYAKRAAKILSDRLNRSQQVENSIELNRLEAARALLRECGAE